MVSKLQPSTLSTNLKMQKNKLLISPRRKTKSSKKPSPKRMVKKVLRLSFSFSIVSFRAKLK